MEPIVSGLISQLGGGLVTALVDGVKAYFPPSMSDEDKARVEMAVTQVANEQQIKLLMATNEVDKEFNCRIASQEGTATDLKGIPVLGAIILFARGCQRPLWGFATMYFDWHWFASANSLSEKQQTALLMINALVLAFLFGERALLNLQPLLEKVFGQKTNGTTA